MKSIFFTFAVCTLMGLAAQADYVYTSAGVPVDTNSGYAYANSGPCGVEGCPCCENAAPPCYETAPPPCNNPCDMQPVVQPVALPACHCGCDNDRGWFFWP